ncbi:S1 family peptidase [Aeromicrobium phragmitis]|uniref:S1 family peptidase n=1 Tax=Aeromicrobium phragmitis TaxID=2478914 RepID=UPI001408A1F1|nr:S1 family peptidase [Aeromicrobium phragmitis]
MTSDQLAWQNEFSELVTSYSMDAERKYSYSEIVAPRDAVLAFGEVAPADLQKRLTMLGGRVKVVEHTGFTELEIEAAASRAAQVIIEHGATSAVAVPDARDRTITLSYSGVTQDSTELQRAQSAIENEVLGDELENAGFLLQFKHSGTEVFEADNFDGGWGLVYGGNVVCTMSFPVRRNSSTALGLLTAGHCPGTGTYGGVSNAFFPPQDGSLWTTTAHPGGDFRWNWSKRFLTGWTYMGQGTRKFSRSANLPYGSNVCKYGHTTQYGCSLVLYKGMTGAVRPHPYNEIMAIGPLDGTPVNTNSGDSGGPYFSASYAVGIYSGRAFSNGQAYASAYSRVPNALSRMNLSLVY